MFTYTNGRRRLVLLFAMLTTLVTAASAQAAYLQLGTTNTSNATTTLRGSTGGPELYITNSNGGQPGVKADSADGTGAAILGVHTAAGGAGPAVQGISDSTQPAAFALFGLLRPSTSGFGSAAVRGQNNGTGANGYGVFGSHAGGGVGVEGSSVSGPGVFGTSSTGTGGGFSGATGVVGTSFAINGNGVRGVANNGAFASGVSGTSSSGAGVYGFSSGGTGQGVSGYSTDTDGVGVLGQANNGMVATGVYGKSTTGAGGRFEGRTGIYSSSAAANGTGVIGTASNGAFARGVAGSTTTGIGVDGTSTATDGTGVRGFAANGYYASGVYGESANGYGVFGKATQTKGWGVYGQSTAYNGKGIVARAMGGGDLSYALMAEAPSDSWAGYFKGDISVSGEGHFHAVFTDHCSGCLGPSSLKIDDPLDPGHKYLQHAGVASAEQLDIYSGNTVTDGHGFATVALPRWFEALNANFRYQLTVVGRSFARAIIWKEIEHNRFSIRTDEPNVKVSWQVTAVRHDPYASAHRSVVEVRKSIRDQGRYLHPELYGKPTSLTVRDRARAAEREPMRRTTGSHERRRER